MRRRDSGWRDLGLAAWHVGHGFHAPAAGMALPMVEYDRGEPLAVISYNRRGTGLPRGSATVAAHRAFGAVLRDDGCQMPFITVQYDPHNWACKMFPHNDSARDLLGARDWIKVPEAHLAATLYRLRGRSLPNLAPYGVTWSDEPWKQFCLSGPSSNPEPWPGQMMSERRRNYEPAQPIPFSLRMPCLDLDLAVVDQDQRLSLVVDYKAPGARIHLGNTNMQAMSGLYVGCGSSFNVPAFVTQYDLDAGTFRAHCLNSTAQRHLSFVLGHNGADADTLADAISGEDWVDLTGQQWLDVLRCARDL